jgi:sec-independent protein translocase protein TatA
VFGLGIPELLIILVMIIILFGAGRISKVAAEVGTGLRSLRDTLKEKNE